MEKIRVIISNRQKQVRVPTGVRMLIRRCCHAVLLMEDFPDPAEISVSFVDNDQIREMNRQYRDKDSVTDVLSFPTLENICGKPLSAADFPYDIDEDGRLFLGSIVICTEVAKAQAEEYGHSYLRELNYLAAHGVCHLLGYDHMTDTDKAAMRAVEERVLKKIDLTRE